MIQYNDLNGFIILNKPEGITSSETCIKVKEILNVKKAGHAGTLDLNVTGVLIIALNNSAKLMPFLNKLDKEYVGKAKIHKDISKKELETRMKEFIGNIKQLPPRKSHVKRQERIRKIYSFKLLNLDTKKKEMEFSVRCEAGTYIRKLIHDFGIKIGGAHMEKLERIKQGPFSIKEGVSLNELNKTKIIKDEEILNKLKQNNF